MDISPKAVQWIINRASVSVPTLEGNLTYTGEEQMPVFTGYDSTKMDIGGTLSATEVGAYTTTFTPKPNYQWEDGTTTEKDVTWSIERATIETVPSQTGSLIYNGNSQTPTWSNYNSSQLTIGGTTSSTNAGTFVATFTPTSNYKWSDGSIISKSVAWTIGKANNVVTFNPTSLTLTSDNPTQTIAVTQLSDSPIVATSSDTNIVTVTVSGNTITVTGVSSGNCSINVSIADNGNYEKFSVDIPVSYTVLSRLPEGYTEVKYISNPNLTYIYNFGTPQVTFNNNYRTELEIELDLSTITNDSYSIFGNSLIYYTGNFPSKSYAIYDRILCGKNSTDNLIYLYIQYGYTAGAVNPSGNTSIQLKKGKLKILVDFSKSIISVNEETFPKQYNAFSTSQYLLQPSLFAYSYQDYYSMQTGSWDYNYGYQPLDYKFYGLKIFNSTAEETGDLINEYVPCINPEGTVGIYDIVNDKFYTSYDTTKVFVAGPTV